MVAGVRREKSLVARAVAAGVRAEMIWGSSNSSVMALPSAIRSGQNATSMLTPRAAIIFSTRAVTPGKTVERRMRSWPSRSQGAQPPRARGIAVWSGLRCSSTGGAEDDDDVLGGGDGGGVGGGGQAAVGDGGGQDGAGAGLVEGQPPGVDEVDGGLADVVDDDPGAAAGERDRQRQAHVPASPDHHHVPPEPRLRPGPGLPARYGIQPGSLLRPGVRPVSLLPPRSRYGIQPESLLA